MCFQNDDDSLKAIYGGECIDDALIIESATTGSIDTQHDHHDLDHDQIHNTISENPIIDQATENIIGDDVVNIRDQTEESIFEDDVGSGDEENSIMDQATDNIIENDVVIVSDQTEESIFEDGFGPEYEDGNLCLKRTTLIIPINDRMS